MSVGTRRTRKVNNEGIECILGKEEKKLFIDVRIGRLSWKSEFCESDEMKGKRFRRILGHRLEKCLSITRLSKEGKEKEKRDIT